MITCKVIEDLLPLYADEICSDDSRTVVEHHIAECIECREKLEAMSVKLAGKMSGKYNVKNPFKKVRLKFVLITFCICLSILLPSMAVFALSLNERDQSGTSWSTLELEYQIKQFAKKMTKGEYYEALEMVDFDVYAMDTEIPDLPDYSEAKEMLAEDFKVYFEKYPITDYEINVEYSMVTPDIKGFLDMKTTGNHFSNYGINFICKNGKTTITPGYRIEMYIDSENDILSPDSDVILTYPYELYTKFPRITEWFDLKRFFDYSPYNYSELLSTVVLSPRTLELYEKYFDSDDASEWSEYCSEIKQINKSFYDNYNLLCNDYKFSSYSSKEPYFVRDNEGLYTRYYKQDVT
ncbi:MAG: zf-HC2 domain-containing protein, partial [Oscillospiraceae bacterium]|nr:zf-HC2 domain-containing protein [Oscillospiraceae bacterium]